MVLIELAALVGVMHHALEFDAVKSFTYIGKGHPVCELIFGGKVSGENWIFRNPAYVAARGMLRRLWHLAEVVWQEAQPGRAGGLAMCEVVSNALQREAADVAYRFSPDYLELFGLTSTHGCSSRNSRKRQR